jgi:uncharacterized membrane protein YphA (DoxX/SURF4 family)
MRWWTDITLLLLRVTLGGYLLAAGVFKVMGELNDGFGSFYNGPFSSMQPSWLPDVMAAPYGYALPWIEVVIGAAVLLGLFTRISAALGFLMVLSFTIALAIAQGRWHAKPADAPGGYFSGNYIQCAAYLVLTAVGAGRLSVDALLGRTRGVSRRKGADDA